MTCSSCKYLNTDKKYEGAVSGCKYYCEKYKTYIDGSQYSCDKYDKNYDTKSVGDYIIILILIIIGGLILSIFV